MGLMTHKKVSEAEARAVLPISAKTKSYTPVSNDELLTTVTDVAKQFNLTLFNGQFSLDHENNGRMLAQFDISGENGQMLGGEAIMKLGVRNSSDKTTAAAIIFGSSLIVCTNGMFVATSKDGICGNASHRHTVNVKYKLFNRMVDSFGLFEHWKTWQERFYVGLKTIPITNEEAAKVIVDAANDGALNKTRIVDVYNEWIFQGRGIENAIEQQQHDEKIRVWYPEFHDRTAYGLFNSFTQIAKEYQAKSPINALTRDISMVTYFNKSMDVVAEIAAA